MTSPFLEYPGANLIEPVNKSPEFISVGLSVSRAKKPRRMLTLTISAKVAAQLRFIMPNEMHDGRPQRVIAAWITNHDVLLLGSDRALGAGVPAWAARQAKNGAITCIMSGAWMPPHLNESIKTAPVKFNVVRPEAGRSVYAVVELPKWASTKEIPNAE